MRPDKSAARVLFRRMELSTVTADTIDAGDRLEALEHELERYAPEHVAAIKQARELVFGVRVALESE